MVGISTPAMAAAVAQAGVLGSIAVGATDAAGARTMIAAVRERHQSFTEDPGMLALLLTERPSAVSFHFGLPGEATIRALRDAGITLLATATSLAEARTAQAAGVHAIVAQGYEAGGHRGAVDPYAPCERLAAMPLTQILVKTIDLPIITTGGITRGPAERRTPTNRLTSTQRGLRRGRA